MGECTFCRKAFTSDLDVTGRFEAFRILRAAAQEAPDDELVDLFLLTSEVVDVRGRMDRRMRLVILLAVSGTLKAALVQQTDLEDVSFQTSGRYLGGGRKGLRAGKSAPSVVASLFLDQLVKVEVAVELVRLGTRVAENTALVQSFGALRRDPPCQRNRSGTGQGDRERAYFEHPLRRHAQEPRARLLQLNCRQWERFPALRASLSAAAFSPASPFGSSRATHHFWVGLVSHRVTVASGSISTIVKTASAMGWSYRRPRRQENEVVCPSRLRPTWMYQNGSGTKALTRSY